MYLYLMPINTPHLQGPVWGEMEKESFRDSGNKLLYCLQREQQDSEEYHVIIEVLQNIKLQKKNYVCWADSLHNA